MSDVIGRITVPAVTPALTFPLVTDFAHGRARKRQVIVHTFGSANAKIEQRFFYGLPATRYQFHRASLGNAQRKQLREFWDLVKGTNIPFYYSVPAANQTFSTKTVVFENQPLSFDDLTNAICSVGLTFAEVNSTGPSYTVNATVTRFPGSTLGAALQDQAQEIIPLLRIRVLDGDVPDIFLSDRRVTVGGQEYLPRLLRLNEPKSDSIVSQSIDGSTDDVTLTFGNADRVMVQLANDTQLRWARVELSLFHVDDATALNGTVLQLWAGYVVSWQSDAGPEFTLKCSDILSALTLSSPVSSVSRTCWRRYGKDGCPAVPGSQAMDTTHFPASDNTKCDLGFNTANGCMAHQVGESYGATYCSPQGVMLRSGGVGFSPGFHSGLALLSPVGALLGATSTWFPRTSMIADSIFGAALPEIWHHDDGDASLALPVACKIAAGRDEDQFYIALGIVGKGPLGAFADPQMITSYGADHPDTFVGSTLDGMPNHGFQVDASGALKSGAVATYGLRQALGSDPAGGTDYFSLGRVATVARGWFTQAADGSAMYEVIGGGSAYNRVFASGVAFCEIRRTKPNSDPLSAPGQHVMVAMVSRGLSGLVWSAPGARTSVGGCVNPFWVAVNTYLSAIGMLGATAGTQEGYFDVAAALAAGALAATTVGKIIGSGTETQFRFKGTIGERKPTRDWLQAVLNSALGYYTWTFGKLKVGCRSNASVVSAYTVGNMLFGSLQLVPVAPAFEKLTVQFEDQEYQFQANTIDYVDQDLAARNRRVQNPLAQTFPVSGCPTKSQAARIAIVRAREEMGGVTQAEQDAARVASWRSTILALDTEVGSVVSITDSEVPGGAGKFRVTGMRINRDWSVDLTAKTVTDSMYDVTVGPKPADVSPAPVPVETVKDSDLPPIVSFGGSADYTVPAGMLQLNGLSFSDTTNTLGITSGTFTIWYADDAHVEDCKLTADLASSATSMSVNNWHGIAEGDLVIIAHEIIRVATISGLTAVIERNQKTDIAYTFSHATEDRVQKLQSKTVNVAFPLGFFAGLGTADVNPDLLRWKRDIPLTGMRAVAADGYVSNGYGNSPVRSVYWASALDYGIGVGSPADSASLGLALQVPGTLAIQADAAPYLALAVTRAATAVKAVVKQAPVGADLTVMLKVGGSDWVSVTIADGTTAATADLTGVGPLTAGDAITLDVTGVGTTYPGADLSVVVYF